MASFSALASRTSRQPFVCFGASVVGSSVTISGKLGQEVKRVV